MFKVIDGGAGSNPDGVADGVSDSPIDEIVREGARRMLTAALQAEVTAYIDRFADQVDDNGHRLVVRNGYHAERQVLTAAGAVTVTAPRVNDKRVDPETPNRPNNTCRTPLSLSATPRPTVPVSASGQRVFATRSSRTITTR